MLFFNRTFPFIEKWFRAAACAMSLLCCVCCIYNRNSHFLRFTRALSWTLIALLRSLFFMSASAESLAATGRPTWLAGGDKPIPTAEGLDLTRDRLLRDWNMNYALYHRRVCTHYITIVWNTGWRERETYIYTCYLLALCLLTSAHTHTHVSYYIDIELFALTTRLGNVDLTDVDVAASSTYVCRLGELSTKSLTAALATVIIKALRSLMKLFTLILWYYSITNWLTFDHTAHIAKCCSICYWIPTFLSYYLS